eukprot:4018782-Pyramimonas_sp.AAC.1
MHRCVFWEGGVSCPEMGPGTQKREARRRGARTRVGKFGGNLQDPPIPYCRPLRIDANRR